MTGYALFVSLAIITVLSPGPGVLLTLTNAIKYGVFGAIGGICGIASGTFIVAGVSATSIGVLISTSTVAFDIMKVIGSLYLIYLGVKLWRSQSINMDINKTTKKSMRVQFVEGVTLQLTKPKAIFFFMSIFPHFVDYTLNYTGQFFILVVTYSSLVLVIHFIYANVAKKARNWFVSDTGSKIVNRAGGCTFICFGIGLVLASR